MATRKPAGVEGGGECSLKNGGDEWMPGSEVRDLGVVAEEIRRRLAAGESGEVIREELKVSYHVMNELLTHSYKFVGRAPEIFAYQERMRIGEE